MRKSIHLALTSLLILAGSAYTGSAANPARDVVDAEGAPLGRVRAGGAGPGAQAVGLRAVDDSETVD